jgi:DNA-binding NarL/FixJ family response regulator
LERIKVLIVDDQDLFAAGIEIILKGYGKDEIQVVGIAYNGQEAVELVERHTPDVVLMDVRMPVMDGVEATRIVHERFPHIKILILTTFDDDQYVLDALGNGALGYILKNIKPDELITSIRAVHTGNFFVSPSIGYRLVRQAHEGINLGAQQTVHYQGEVNFILSRFESLTTREAEILHFLLEDYDNGEIAEKLFIAEQTARNHVSAIYAKLGVPDRTHAKKLAKSILAE